jgi:hypothetical protein
MKRSAEKVVKDLIRKYREVCDRLGDCPTKKARQPGQLDCICCIFSDIDVVTGKQERTEYNSTITKLEAIDNEAMFLALQRQMRRNINGQGQAPLKK